MLLASPPGPIAINDNLYEKLAFQPSKFEPVIVLGTVPNVLLVKPAFPAKTAAELIDYVKANPGKVSFASQGNGSTSHLSAMLFQKLTGTEMVHVPYRGTAPALQDIMGNHIDLFFDNLGSSLNLHNAGNLRILALGSPGGCRRCRTSRRWRRWAWTSSNPLLGLPWWPRLARLLRSRRP